MTDLASKKCVACESGMPPMSRDSALDFLKQVPGWTLREAVPFKKVAPSGRVNEEGNRLCRRYDAEASLLRLGLERDFKFKNFNEAVTFVNKVAELAETEGHHPNILIHSWNKVKLTFYTHAIGGLSENDFIMAAKVNHL